MEIETLLRECENDLDEVVKQLNDISNKLWALRLNKEVAESEAQEEFKN